ncbi:hypothetical protein Hrubri_2458 [Herbaspirillum rubrisubalbicans M1]|uniref:hypothetical protein n=1 Tax=Herbaspirillum rubrisubalbicans TaxID=80842 RepID=UPI00073A0257|nr:hypothetical protein [Herbaspirillum rubrisubalbicans]ALU89643.1 hypothetical protein Hrubri_2458 [Herbaspirillum rubrisubalbicans M1]
MSISRINTHGHSRAIDYALFLRDYIDMQDSQSTQAAAPVSSAPAPVALPSAPAKALDHPRRGTRAFLERAPGAAQSRVSNKRRYGDSSEIVQGAITHWQRMDTKASDALEAIPQGDELARGTRVDKPYMRRVSEGRAVAQKGDGTAAAPTLANKNPRKWTSGLSKALRERAQFARVHGVLFEAPWLPSSGLTQT